jgi:mxaJ protein
MSSRFRNVAGAAALLLLGAASGSPDSAEPNPAVLRVCSDPNNLPFSNRRGEGFENRIAGLLASDLGARLEYFWWPERRGFVRNTVDANRCDLVIGVPANFGGLLTTRPYYRSTYVFVARRDESGLVTSLDDTTLRRLRIGVPFTGGRGQPPPADALGRRGLARNVRAYSVSGDYRRPNPPARLIDAVARGDVDVAIAWGPLAGYFAPRAETPLVITPVRPAVDASGERMTFAIAMGVGRGDSVLQRRVQVVLDRRAGAIRQVLERYGVPLVPLYAAEEGP